MTPQRIKQIADRHLEEWFHADPETSTKVLRDHVEEAIAAALYEEGCNTGTGPRDINIPEFVRKTPEE